MKQPAPLHTIFQNHISWIFHKMDQIQSGDPPRDPATIQGRPPSNVSSTSSEPAFRPELSLILKSPPPLHPDWLAYEVTLGLNAPESTPDQILQPAPLDYEKLQRNHSQACKERNARLLSGRDSHLDNGLLIQDTFIEANSLAEICLHIPIRSYKQVSTLDEVPSLTSSPIPPQHDVVIYYHGGGLCVGDLDSEDLTCRRIVEALNCTVYSIRLPTQANLYSLKCTTRCFKRCRCYHRDDRRRQIDIDGLVLRCTTRSSSFPTYLPKRRGEREDPWRTPKISSDL